MNMRKFTAESGLYLSIGTLFSSCYLSGWPACQGPGRQRKRKTERSLQESGGDNQLINRIINRTINRIINQ
ncbi:predicted protein [Methanosarcina acetivorans C2A]|uniref:Lipoprotein n=1 Tax=Methanosarcina acetivorans (strain ATCC 35395 / DSM 2834 / JCM 12185 / C2A) TaxID=188937 RepID=Q8TQ32_METAC|nr:predicted protein [Methanosarcina acetivorans C2A]